MGARAVHHGRALLPTLWHGWLWSRRIEPLPNPFWLFLGSACLFNLGVFLVVLLYNLYVLDLGFRENFLGTLSGLHTVGSIAVTLPAAWIARRFGLRPALLLCFSGFAVISTIRVSVTGATALAAWAIAGGAVLSMWPVLMAPAITQLAGERNSTRAFSLFFATGIGVGILGGLLGGHMPSWLQSAGSSAVLSKQQTMLFGVIVAAVAMLPLLRVGLARLEQSAAAIPRSRALVRLLAVMAVWNLATGAFNPFFNAYFSRHVGVDIAGIGNIFAGGQLAQVGALLLAPALLTRLGLTPGIAVMQAATAFALTGLAVAPNTGTAVASYAAYMSFQWMSEPGIYSVLMGLVKPADRAAAAAMNVLAMQAAQAAAASLSGAAIQRFGYPATLITAAMVALAAAGLFRLLVRSPEAPACDTALG